MEFWLGRKKRNFYRFTDKPLKEWSELILDANYLCIKWLMNLAAAKKASRIKRWDPERGSGTFNIVGKRLAMPNIYGYFRFVALHFVPICSAILNGSLLTWIIFTGSQEYLSGLYFHFDSKMARSPLPYVLVLILILSMWFKAGIVLHHTQASCNILTYISRNLGLHPFQ